MHVRGSRRSAPQILFVGGRMSAADHPFTRFAALTAFGELALLRLDAELCPACGSVNKQFRDEISRREHEITGLCQACQDKAKTL